METAWTILGEADSMKEERVDGETGCGALSDSTGT
jgi:hypothetical protein